MRYTIMGAKCELKVNIIDGKRKHFKIIERICWCTIFFTIGYVVVTTMLNYSGFIIYEELDQSLKDVIGKFPEENENEPVSDLPPPPVPAPAQCDKLDDNSKFDCFPRGPSNQTSCEKRGCCWSIPKDIDNVPYCYYPKDYFLYKYVNLTSTDYGVTGFMEASYSSPYPNNIKRLKIEVKFETVTRLHIKIYDAEKTRYEPPFPEVPIMNSATKNASYTVNIDKEKGGFNVVRRSNQKVIFGNIEAGGFIFSDQFLQLSAFLPTKNIYGLGVQRNNFLLDTNWDTVTMFNRDQVPTDNVNLYSTHPFLMGLEEGGLSYGVMLLNSNAMDVVLQPAPAITFRTIGGILDFYFFLGPEPTDVVQQFTELVGKPIVPPYWSLGFHLCRWGYKSLDHIKDILKKNEDAGVFVETQWVDIDYMNERNDFTYDKENFGGLKEFIDDLHKKGQRFVMILDPGVSGSEPKGSYPPYDDAVKYDLLVKDDKGQPLVGKVWNPETTVFPDFTHPKAHEYWLKQIKDQHDNQFSFDGIWIDMNEPSNDVQGSIYGCPNNRWENPPYIPHVTGGTMKDRTICMSAKHYIGLHYDIHNINGMAEAILTHNALIEATGKRPFIISRSSFLGQGKYTGVWSGDVVSSWDDMFHSIPDILNYNIQGIPMVGADICGFVNNATKSLCQRWYQLGAFYPFSRSHNTLDAVPQDPASMGKEVVDSFRKSYLIRYTLLPYLYTLFWQAHLDGLTVARALLFEYPKDEKTYAINKQFLLGPALHIIPVLEEGMTYVKGYLPKDRWFDYYTNMEVAKTGLEISIPAPLDTIPLFLRGGYILPTQEPGKTTDESRVNPFGLIAIPNEKMEATGTLYWDDGESVEAYERGNYIVLKFSQKVNTLTSTITAWHYNTSLTLGSVSLLGVKSSISKVIVNGEVTKSFKYDTNAKHLSISSLKVNLSKPISITWS